MRHTIGALFLLLVLAIGAADAGVHGAWVAFGLLVGIALVAISLALTDTATDETREPGREDA